MGIAKTTKHYSPFCIWTKGTYIEELGYTLCNSRADHNPSCVVKYEIEKRYLSEDRNKQIYKIVINYHDTCKGSNLSLQSDFEELFELIRKYY